MRTSAAWWRRLGQKIILRARLDAPEAVDPGRQAYLRRVNTEHESVYDAIAGQDADAARAAMRTHLANSRERRRRAYLEDAAGALIAAARRRRQVDTMTVSRTAAGENDMTLLSLDAAQPRSPAPSPSAPQPARRRRHVADEAGPHHRAVPAGRLFRHHRARDQPAAVAKR